MLVNIFFQNIFSQKVFAIYFFFNVSVTFIPIARNTLEVVRRPMSNVKKSCLGGNSKNAYSKIGVIVVNVFF